MLFVWLLTTLVLEKTSKKMSRTKVQQRREEFTIE
jgi:hypothetical protein